MLQHYTTQPLWSDVAKRDSNMNNVNKYQQQLDLSLLGLSITINHRCTSTASTPTSSISDTSRSVSPMQLSSEDEIEQEEDSSNVATSNFIHSVTSFSTLANADYDLSYRCRHFELAMDDRIEEDEDTLSFTSDHTDIEAVEGEGVPIEDDQDELDQLETDDDTHIGEDSDFLTSFPSFTDFSHYRIRHRAIDPALFLSRYQSWRYCDRRQRDSDRHVRHFAGPANPIRLQIASSNACMKPAKQPQADRTIPEPKSQKPLLSPWEHPRGSYVNQPKRVVIPRDPLDVAADQKLTAWRSNGKDKKNGAHRHARRALMRRAHLLSAPTRPAIKHARSAAHRVVLQLRFKSQQRRARAGKKCGSKNSSPHIPRYLRTCSVAKKAVSKPTPKSFVNPSVAPPNGGISVTSCCGFEDFRRTFYEKFRPSIETALCNNGIYHIDSVRLCPPGPGVAERFMSRMAELRAHESDVRLVYHGTRFENMQSICKRGLLVPDPSKNGVHVQNGSAYGVGIYSATDASVSTSYMRNTCTMFVCAALTTGAKPVSSVGTGGASPQAIVQGSFVVLMENARIMPLFLLDIEYASHRYSTSSSGITDYRAPGVRRELARALLRKFHKKLCLQYGEQRNGVERQQEEMRMVA